MNSSTVFDGFLELRSKIWFINTWKKLFAKVIQPDISKDIYELRLYKKMNQFPNHKIGVDEMKCISLSAIQLQLVIELSNADRIFQLSSAELDSTSLFIFRTETFQLRSIWYRILECCQFLMNHGTEISEKVRDARLFLRECMQTHQQGNTPNVDIAPYQSNSPPFQTNINDINAITQVYNITNQTNPAINQQNSHTNQITSQTNPLINQQNPHTNQITNQNQSNYVSTHNGNIPPQHFHQNIPLQNQNPNNMNNQSNIIRNQSQNTNQYHSNINNQRQQTILPQNHNSQQYSNLNPNTNLNANNNHIQASQQFHHNIGNNMNMPVKSSRHYKTTTKSQYEQKGILTHEEREKLRYLYKSKLKNNVNREKMTKRILGLRRVSLFRHINLIDDAKYHIMRSKILNDGDPSRIDEEIENYLDTLNNTHFTDENRKYFSKYNDVVVMLQEEEPNH